MASSSPYKTPGMKPRAPGQKPFFEPVFACYIRRSTLPTASHQHQSSQPSQNNHQTNSHHVNHSHNANYPQHLNRNHGPFAPTRPGVTAASAAVAVAFSSENRPNDGIPYIDDNVGTCSASRTSRTPYRPTTPRPSSPRGKKANFRTPASSKNQVDNKSESKSKSDTKSESKTQAEGNGGSINGGCAEGADREENLRSGNGKHGKRGPGLPGPGSSPFKGVFPGLTSHPERTDRSERGTERSSEHHQQAYRTFHHDNYRASTPAAVSGTRAGPGRHREQLFEFVNAAVGAAPSTPRKTDGVFLSRGDAYVNSGLNSGFTGANGATARPAATAQSFFPSGGRREEDGLNGNNGYGVDSTNVDDNLHENFKIPEKKPSFGQHRPGIDRLLHAFLSNNPGRSDSKPGVGEKRSSGNAAGENNHQNKDQNSSSSYSGGNRGTNTTSSSDSRTTTKETGGDTSGDEFFVSYYLNPWRDYERAWKEFESHSKSPSKSRESKPNQKPIIKPIISALDIPLPPGAASGTILRRAWKATVFAEKTVEKSKTAGEGTSGGEKAVFVKLQRRYHPDKFIARFGERITEDALDGVQKAVREITASLNTEWKGFKGEGG